MTRESYQQTYERYLQAIEPALKQALLGRIEPLEKSMGYSLLSGGKRLRPVLTLASCALLGGELSSALPFAAAVEMIHAYSLIHDDLPCMDDDDLRRGQPTNHKVFGEAMAVLAGDGLQSLAYETMLHGEMDTRKWRAMQAVAKGAGTRGMVSGQVRDMEATGHKIEIEQLRTIHREKTGGLILAACQAGAYMAGGSEEDLARISTYAQNLGLAFQIADDILDVTATAEELGKTPGKDEKEQKTTYVSLYGVEKAQALAEKAADEAARALAGYGEKAEFLSITAKNAAKRRK